MIKAPFGWKFIEHEKYGRVTAPTWYGPHKRCSEDCCHATECCPRGIIERIQNYRYMRSVTDITFREYWWHEFKSLIGLNKVKEDEWDL